ncbi:Hypothetical protein PHPALM_488 [Phytophthora palmivora]|uniref:Reverse transcriptase domain-containing protein n=1 Tax=Phytophthora palmivora TaxID=4796 RepID=A0A2P4YUN5_9STRA|nr:Hypothetical protein PHPALM_488 [Phytophthora palmivora]
MDETEVRLSIEHGKPGKACGPDELGNAWYRDHVDKLVPILTKLFNAWFTRGDTPKSFLEAYIHSISKGGDRSNPLNYRPIALLNSDYKIFTRILAWRVRNHISQLVHPTQFGFVPGKTIHEAIDLYEAAKILCGSRPELHGAEVLLLDFAKAYDSLNRSFLLEVLRAKGFPPKFCAMIYAIHEGTAVQFLANGSLSSAVPVTSGIRQGCPLAPLLFILAVDLLYDEVEATAGVHGLNLGDHEGVVRLDVAGYADDSAIYLADKSMQAEAILAVGRFSAVSGLCLNVKKSAAIALGRGPEEIQGEPDHHRQEVPQVQSTRYLGHIAGSGNITEMAWTKAAQALRVRLLLTETKTTTVEQRARIAAAIIIPKLLYVARHAWPSEDVIKNADARIKNYVWRAQFTIPDTPAKGWVSSVMAMQETKWGGLGVPNLRLELIALSASTVGDWTVTLNPYRKKAGDILMSRENLSLEPLVQRSHPPAPKYRSAQISQRLQESGGRYSKTRMG